MSNDQSAKTSAEQQAPPPTVVAWGIRFICIAILIALLGFFVYHALNADKPIQFENKIDDEHTEMVNNNLHVQLKTTNKGDMSAEQVILELKVPHLDFSQQQVLKIIGPHEEVSSTFIIDAKIPLDSIQMTVTSYVST